MIRALLSFLAMVMLSGAMATPAAAGPKPGTCSGTLSRLPEGEWVIRTGREGICVFGGDDIKTKVLAVCSAGKRCEVSGVIGDCEDGECSEIRSLRVLHITATSRTTLTIMHIMRPPLARSREARARAPPFA